MQIVEAIFRTPIEVTQFWASERYLVHETRRDDLLVHFVVDHPEPGDWYFQVSNGEGTPCIADVIEPFLPTRENLLALDAGCREGCRQLEIFKRDTDVPPPKENLFVGIERYRGSVIRDVDHPRFQRDFFRVLADDWGIDLPDVEKLGERDIVLRYKQGMPCAAAMVKAVQPVLEAVRGTLTVKRQATSLEGGRRFDVMEYVDSSGTVFVQRFDISEYFGKSLPYTQFRFDLGV